MAAIRMPEGKFACVKCDSLKRAALLFDRIGLYIPATAAATPDLSFLLELPSIDDLHHRHGLTFFATVASPELNREYLDSIAEQVTLMFEDSSLQSVDQAHPFDGALTGMLSSLPLVVEDACTWDQVWEFRRDAAASGKYRRLRTWVIETLRAKSSSEAVDIIGARVEDYEWALRKHGLTTTTGILRSVLSADSVISASALAIVSGASFGASVATISGGLLLAARAATEVAGFLTDRQNIRRSAPGSECALIYDIHSLFAGAA